MRKVHEFTSGKNDWNTFEVGLRDENIIVRDETGMIEFEEDAIDKLFEGINQAREELREKKRRPTRPTGE